MAAKQRAVKQRAPARKPRKSATLKTAPTKTSFAALLETLPADRRAEAKTLAALMQKHTGAAPVIWGSAIVGFGDVHLTYATGRELDWFRCGFAVRKKALALYGLKAADGSSAALLKQLGPHEEGAGCVLLKKLEHVDPKVLGQLIARAAA
ncbi:MAG: DUF1801 domain-containing protein [Myxococcus sp.]|nr:DUF1801 domain-containing protein [Myxococcus sp.]